MNAICQQIDSSNTKGTKLKRYKNLDGNSGVIAYEISEAAITVQFSDAAYLYTTKSVGSGNLVEMQRLAVAGRGLSTFISRYVRQNYAKKLA